MKNIAGSKMWNMRIGLEIHAQIITASKLFSAARVGNAHSPPNNYVSLFDAATPG
jgi:aspartyl-tRNA(Asn)/glutamyl-tRNA(Gln) amidotransferase subunit B